MPTKEVLSEVIDVQVNNLRKFSANFSILGEKLEKGHIAPLYEKCASLKKSINSATDPETDLVEIEKDIYLLEIECQRVISRIYALTTLPVIIILSVILYYLIYYTNIFCFFMGILDINAPERLISLGVAGAFIYIITSYMSDDKSYIIKNHHLHRFFNFILRLSLAIVVPLVLVILFFDSEGAIKNIEMSPEILSFACGYSSKLVIDILNKIVEKAADIIKAI